MARIEINIDDITTTIDQMWKTKGEQKKDDKHKGQQKKSVRKPKQE